MKTTPLVDYWGPAHLGIGFLCACLGVFVLILAYRTIRDGKLP